MFTIPCLHRAVAAVTVGSTAGVGFTGIASAVVVANTAAVRRTIDTGLA